MSYLPVRPNPLNLDVKEPSWKSLIQKLDMVSYHCSMPVLENVQVSLNEILEVRGQPLEEWELWSVLFQTTQAVQDIFLRGQACKDGEPQYLVTPHNLLCSARGRIVLNTCFPDKIKGTPYWCQELNNDNFQTQSSVLEKIYVFTIGQTLLHAAHYEESEGNKKKFSPLIKTVFQAMCQNDVDLRMVLSDVDQVCSLHAEKYMNGLSFTKAIAKLHQEVLGSLPENEILTQVNQDFMKEDDTEDLKDENIPNTDYTSKYLSYGQRLGYHPEFSSNGNYQTKKKQTPKELWKEAYRKVLMQIRKSKKTFLSKEEVLSAWKTHKAHESIFRVYEELTERRKMLELLRLSINIDPVASTDVDKNPLLTTGMKPKTIAELVLLLQRPKQSTIYSKSFAEEPKNDNAALNDNSKSHLSSTSFSSHDSENYEKPFYNIDKVALNDPFSGNNSPFDSLIGPEFIVNQLKPHTHLAPFCTNKNFHSSAFTVIVHLLNGDSLDIECIPSVTGKQLYKSVADHLKLRERYLFGLSFMHGDEHIFIERKQQVFDLLHSTVAFSDNRIQLHFRVKFYLNDIHLMRTPSLRHLYYLQLRNDFVDGNYHCDNNIALTVGGFALQVEFGDYEPSSHGKEYFLLEHYLPFFNIEKLNRHIAKAKLNEYHIKFEGLSKELAELKFIQALMKLPEYGCHFHKVYQDKRNFSSAVWLGIKDTGIQVYEKVSGKKSVCQFYSWPNLKRISFCRNYFCLSPRTESYSGKHVIYRFFTAVTYRSQYLFTISMAYHKFYLKLRTVSKASEIFIEDLDEEYHYFCDKSGMKKEIGCDLYDTRGKFQWKTKTLRHRSSSQNDLEFLNEPYVLESSQSKNCYVLKHKAKSSSKMQKENLPSSFVARSSSAPNPLKKSKWDCSNMALSKG
ncbi:FERM and PDZ domain-containing protein 2 [Caerostris darwini]|uniref:FERM and PDZ domain-containing protein 2 n=1 Tax=Caerostris darwini TaxID=1538125 RepID=A0AAV4V6J8_9ARAC|nr:FERM and PDZ domain-containing protein 2 [Caerostris darwini]